MNETREEAASVLDLTKLSLDLTVDEGQIPMMAWSKDHGDVLEEAKEPSAHAGLVVATEREGLLPNVVTY